MTEPTVTNWQKAVAETNRLQRELDITNADHIALWIEANTIPDEPMSQCASWLACRIVEAHEAAAQAERERLAALAGDGLVEAIARIIAPSRWRVMDSCLEQAKRKYAGQNVGWPADQFQDKESMVKARAILPLIAAQKQAGEPVAWQRRLQYPLASDAPGRVYEWEKCSAKEATGYFEKAPGYEYRPLYTAPPTAKDERNKALDDVLGFGCPICGGDCGSANPPVNNCWMRNINALKED